MTSSSVAPFSMLVPVAGFLSAGILLHERPEVGDLVGGVLVILGVLAPTLVAVRRHLRGGSTAEDDVELSAVEAADPT